MEREQRGPRRRARGDDAKETGIVRRGIEQADLQRVDVDDGDSGRIETLPDGSVSIPLFEEQVVVEKRLVVRERVVVRKQTVVEDHVVEADLRRERLEVDADPSLVEDV